MRNSIYELPEKITERKILQSSDLDSEVWKEFVNTNYNSENAKDTLKAFGEEDGELSQSSPFRIAALANMTDNYGVFPNKQKPGNRDDIEYMVKEQPDYFNGIYADFGLALVTPTDSYEPNKLLAEKLYEQLTQRKITLPGEGLLIPLSILARPREDNDSAYGLILEINSKLPTDFVKEHLRNIADYHWDWTRDEGLASAYRDDRYWDRNDWDLGDSDSVGRVVGVGEADAPKNL